MQAGLQKSIISVSKSICSELEHHWKHVSFIVDGRSIVAVGWNQPFKTHPLASKFGYRYNAIHSELHAILKFEKPVKYLNRLLFVNVRIDKFGKLKQSRPCGPCQMLLRSFGVKKVEYSNSKGEFECLDLNMSP